VHVKAVVVVLTTVVFGTMGLVWALDCEGRLVSLGHAPWEVHAICGEPTQIEDTLQLIHKPVYGPSGRVVDYFPMAVPKSMWTYNFGSSRLVYLLTFLEGKLVKIDTAGYGR
jgi:Protein of unknown function (DUF2845)